jgi:hypothetical protein
MSFAVRVGSRFHDGEFCRVATFAMMTMFAVASTCDL